MFADTVFAFPSKDATLGLLFGGFISHLNGGGDRIEKLFHLDTNEENI